MGEPQKVGVAWIDIFTGLYGVIGIQSALAECGRSGLGQPIDLSLLDCGAGVLANQATHFLLGGLLPKRMGPDTGNQPPRPCQPRRVTRQPGILSDRIDFYASIMIYL